MCLTRARDMAGGDARANRLHTLCNLEAAVAYLTDPSGHILRQNGSTVGINDAGRRRNGPKPTHELKPSQSLRLPLNGRILCRVQSSFEYICLCVRAPETFLTVNNTSSRPLHSC